MTSLSFVHDFFLTCSLLVHDFFLICSLLDESVNSEPDCPEAEGDNWPGRRLAMRNYSLRVRVQAESNLE